MSNKRTRNFRGVMKTEGNQEPEEKTLTLILSEALRHYLPIPVSKSEPGSYSENQLFQILKRQTINHKKYYRKLIAKRENLDPHLLRQIWKSTQTWCQKNLHLNIEKPCQIETVIPEEMPIRDAVSLFEYEENECQILIRSDILNNTPYFLVCLLHEYFHYIHFVSVPYHKYHICPLILCEGLAEYGCRFFHRESNYDIPADLKKSWDCTYEAARYLVEHISMKEGFGIQGFFYSFLHTIEQHSPLNHLDSLFNQY